jgi:diaminohydroxyphosphoribosylaminopyrimidine deaminase/5-amino-6-(5-phosphoribosylamino)uracil reductase
MERALDLAELGRSTTHPNPRVGCVIVRDGECVGEGWHERAGGPHAEVAALAVAGERARGADLYVTLEPCCHVGRTGPCTEALIHAGVQRVYAAIEDPNPRVAGRGIQQLEAARISTHVGLGAARARELNRGFIQRMRQARPWVSFKVAHSLDGRIALADGSSRWISGEAAREDVHRLRAEAGAVLVSSATVLADDPALTVRIKGVQRQPDRIVLDSRARVPDSAKVWMPGAGRIALVGPGVLAAAHARLAAQGVGVFACALGETGGLDLHAVLAELARQAINEVLVECGGQLAAAFLQAGLVDEVVAYVTPQLLGSDALPMVRMPGPASLTQALRFGLFDVVTLGEDVRIRLRAARPGH